MVTSTSLSYLHHVPPGPVAALFPPHAIFRVRYGDISSDGFTWSAAVSDDDSHCGWSHNCGDIEDVLDHRPAGNRMEHFGQL